MDQLDDELIEDYVSKFFGYGSWEAPLWFVGMEEGGGGQVCGVKLRLEAWRSRGRRELEDLPDFQTEHASDHWHGEKARLQPTWRQLVRILLIARGESDSNSVIREHQRNAFGRRGKNADVCLSELMPLPSPGIDMWNYLEWSKIHWLITRDSYEEHVLASRTERLREKVREHGPRVVVFYGTIWKQRWGKITGGDWVPVFDGLSESEHKGTWFFMIRHPTGRLATNRFFRDVGLYLRVRSLITPQ